MVLLLTDELANEGIKSKDGILGEMRKLQSPPDQTGDRKVREDKSNVHNPYLVYQDHLSLSK